jgi:AcrR family transcriptional regulator
MPPKSNRKKILSNSARLFSQKGYQGTSMRDVASSVGVTLPTIYHYFGSKRKLYDEAKIEIFSRRSNRHIKHLHTDKDAASRIRDYLLALATDLMNNQIYYKLMHREMLDQGKSGLRRLSEESFKEGFDELSAVLSGMELKRSSAMLAMTLYSLLFGLISTMRYAVYLDDSFEEFQSPEYFVRLTLDQLIPEVDWSKIT